MYKKKIIYMMLVVFICVVLILSFSLAGCKNTVPAETTAAEATTAETAAVTAAVETTAAAEPVELVFWHLDPPDSPQVVSLKEIVANYEKEHPNVKVDLIAQPGNDMQTIIQVSAAANRGADIIMNWTGIFNFPFVDKLIDLRDYITKEDISAFIPGAMLYNYNSYDLNDKIISLPAFQGLMFHHVMYNKAMFKEAGITWEPTPENGYSMTWDEFKDSCNKLKAAGFTPLGMGNDGGWMSTWFVTMFSMQTFDKDDFSKLFKREMKYNDPKVVEVFSKLNELYKAGYFNVGCNTLGWDEGMNLLKNKKVAMFANSWPLNEKPTYETLGEDFGMMKYPIFNPGNPLSNAILPINGGSYLIPTWSKYPEVAVDLLMYTLSKENSEKMFVDAGIFPTRSDFDESLIDNPNTALAWKWIKTNPDTGNVISLDEVTPTEIANEEAPLIISMLNGDITPQQVCDRLQARVEQLDYPWFTK